MTPSILLLLVTVTNGCFLLSLYLKKRKILKKMRHLNNDLSLLR